MREGRSVDTTMGFTVLDGLLMGTRPGTLDPGAVTYLMREHAMSAAEIEDVLYHRSGLVGVSGISSDMRTLLASGNSHAHEAVELFVFRAAREIGALAASLGGLDGQVFTAGIGEHAPEIRSRICARCAWLDISLDEHANDAAGPRSVRRQAACMSMSVSGIKNQRINTATRAVAAMLRNTTVRPKLAAMTPNSAVLSEAPTPDAVPTRPCARLKRPVPFVRSATTSAVNTPTTAPLTPSSN